MNNSRNSVYLDYMASTPVDPRVFEAMRPHFLEQYGNPHAVDHAFGWQAQQAVLTSAQEIATLIGADADEIIFTSGATEANNLAILGLAARAPEQRRRLLVSAVEHKCVLEASEAARRRFGLAVEYLPVDRSGVVDLDVLKKRLADDVLCVSVMAVNNEVGSIQPLAEIGRLCEGVGAVFHCDAAQAPLAVRIQVSELGIGMLSLSGHKIYGPKGIGAAFLRRDVQKFVEPLIYGGGQQQNLRSGTVPTPLCVGFGKAANLLTGPEWDREYALLSALRTSLEAELRSWECAYVNGASGARHPGCLNVRFDGFIGRDVIAALQPHFSASTGSACTSGLPEPSHVLRAMGLSGEEAEASIRFSVGRFTTAEEIDLTLQALRDALPRIAAAA